MTMKMRDLGIICLSLLGLAACSDEASDDSNDSIADIASEISISTSASDVNRILTGSTHPLDRSFYVDTTFVTQNNVGNTVTTQIAQLSQAILQINDYNAQPNSYDYESRNEAADLKYSISAISSNPEIAKVENGQLVGVSPGKATITYTVTSDAISIANQDTNLEPVEITVCPYDYIALQTGDNTHQTGNFLSYSAEPLEIASDNSTFILTALPIISNSTLSKAGLTSSDCPTETSLNNFNLYEIAGRYINQVNLDLEGNTQITSTAGHSMSFGARLGSAPVRNLLGLNFSQITRTIIEPTDISDVRITELGYDNQLAILAANPVKVVGFSKSLGRDVDLTAIYTTYNSSSNSSIIVSNDTNCGSPYHCFDKGQKTAAITLEPRSDYQNIDGLPIITSETLPLVDARLDFSISHKTAATNEIIEMSSLLIIGDKKYDVSNFMVSDYQHHPHLTKIDINFNPNANIQGNDNTIIFGKWAMFREIGNGTITAGFNDYSEIELPTQQIEAFKIGLATDSNIQGRWLQADSGLDYYIGAYDPLDFSVINDNQLTYQSVDGNTTNILLRAGIKSVAVSGSVNVVGEAAVQINALQNTDSKSKTLAPGISPDSQNFSPQANGGLINVASIDMILENANTGDKIDVSIEPDGSFSESIPTGIYNVTGTVIDGSIIYNIDTQITVEKNATDTGTLNLAKVGLHNFDISITKGCDHNYKCYAGKQYEFTITARNTGVIASSSIEATIESILAHENVTQFQMISNPITGAASGDSIEYRFTATFSQPVEDTVIKMPISLTDIDGRTWNDSVSIELSQYPSIDVNIKAHNDSLAANVRGYLMLEGRTPIRVNGRSNTIKVPNKPGAIYELILANQVYNQETPYAVSVNSQVSDNDISTATGIISKNENADNVVGGATGLTLNEKNIAYISAGDVDYYLINIPMAP